MSNNLPPGSWSTMIFQRRLSTLGAKLAVGRRSHFLPWAKKPCLASLRFPPRFFHTTRPVPDRLRLFPRLHRPQGEGPERLPRRGGCFIGEKRKRGASDLHRETTKQERTEMQSKESEAVPQPPAYPGTEPAPNYPPPVPQVPYGSTGYVSGPTVPAFQYHPATSGLVPLQSQPAAPVIWMPTPPAPPKCPPGLEYLTQIDQLVVEQQMDITELLTRFETLNRYAIKNSMGQRVYFAAEENDEYTLQCHGTLRGFVIKLFDSTNQPVMQLSRECQCSICCCPCICGLQELEVQAPLGTVIGYVKQTCHPCLPKFDLQNETRECLLKMKGPCVPCQCYQDVHFEVKTLDETATIGILTKQWTGLAREAVGSASLFGIQFPLDLDVKMKALILGASILLDFMFFEQRQQQRQQQRR